ncbi:MAG: transcriptional regulator [Cyanobacteria bacterium P01_A01_bin.114]
MSKVVSTRLQDETFNRLSRVARILGKTPSDTVATLVEESLREIEFAFIEFRNSALGRQAFMKGSSLAAWEVIQVAQAYEMDVAKVASHFERPAEWVKAALNYAEAYPEEIAFAIEDAQAITSTTVKRLLPDLEVVAVPPED